MLTINGSELVLTVFNFFLLLFLLKRFLYTPLIAFMDARNARIEAALEQERNARKAIQEEEVLHEAKCKQSQEEARRMVRDGHTADELRHAELMVQTQAKNLCDRKAAKVAACQRNQEEKLQVEEAGQRLAVLLAEALLDHFPDMPSVLVGNGLRLAVEKAESTWEQDASEVQQRRASAAGGEQRSADLFAPECMDEADAELQKSREEQRQLEEKWEQLAALLAERLLCPGA